MDKQVLTTLENTISRLKKIIVGERFVNCYCREFSPENQLKLEKFLSKLKESYKDIIYVDIHIQVFEGCKNEEIEANVLLGKINRETTAKGLDSFHQQAISIANALYKWSNSLDRRALLVFHCFHDRYNEKEKNILRSLRKALRNRNKLSGYLGILIVSNRDVSQWELFPESNLDERNVAIFNV